MQFMDAHFLNQTTLNNCEQGYTLNLFLKAQVFKARFSASRDLIRSTTTHHWGRCGVVSSTLTFRSIGHRFSNPGNAYFPTSLQQAEITGEVLTGRFS